MRVGVNILPDSGWAEASRQWRTVEELGFRTVGRRQRLGFDRLHVLPTAQLGWWLAALSTMKKFGNNGTSDTERVCRAVGTLLCNRVLSRDELAAGVGPVDRLRQARRLDAV